MIKHLLPWFILFLPTLVFSSEPWPGEPWWESENLTALDNDFPNNLSGAHWNPVTRSLWVCINGPAKFWIIKENELGDWVIDYQGAEKGQIEIVGDLEGITQVDLEAPFVYLIDESTDNIVKYDVTDYGNPLLVASWNISAFVPTNAGSGSEGITFVPDQWLSKNGFVDGAGNPYTSQNGMGGLMLIAHQNGGRVYAFDLDANGTNVDFVGSYQTSRTESSGLEFDRSSGYLFVWHNMDSNYIEVSDLSSFDIGDGTRKLTRLVQYVSPKAGNLEGFALSAAEDDEFRAFFTDDDNQDGYALMVYNQFKPALAVPDAYTVQENSTLNVTGPGLLDNDYSGTQVILKSEPVNGVLQGLYSGDLFDGSFSYQPNTGFVGKDVFTYSIDNIQIAEVVITVTEQPAPVTQAGSINRFFILYLLLVSVLKSRKKLFNKPG